MSETEGATGTALRMPEIRLFLASDYLTEKNTGYSSDQIGLFSGFLAEIR